MFTHTHTHEAKTSGHELPQQQQLVRDGKQDQQGSSSLHGVIEAEGYEHSGCAHARVLTVGTQLCACSLPFHSCLDAIWTHARRGVFWDRKTKRWRCQLGYQSKKIFLGYFDDAGEAARAYDQKLVELRGAGGKGHCCRLPVAASEQRKN